MKMVFSVVPYVCCAISYATATDQLHSGGARALITDGNLARFVITHTLTVQYASLLCGICSRVTGAYNLVSQSFPICA